MVDAAPQALTPLAGRTGPAGGPHHAGIVLGEAAGLILIGLRGDAADPAFAATAEQVLGIAPPSVANTVAVTEGASILWLGPDEWLAIAKDQDGTALCGRLEEAMAGLRHAVVDLSDNYTVIDLSGHASRWVLAKGWAQDLHPSVFAPGRCSQGMLAHAQIILERTGDEAYRLIVRPSFAAYLWDWLVDAAADVGHRVVAA